jgi:ATP-dependent Clp protease adapter protein ClpS
MRVEVMQRMREVEENAIETAKEMTDSELRKREQQYDVLKKHVDFCTKVGVVVSVITHYFHYYITTILHARGGGERHRDG